MNEPTQGTARTFYAHSLPAAPGKEAPPSITEWEPLEEHLRKVAKLAESFAAAWNAGVWGLVLGLWHDLGKYTIDFLNYLFSANGVEAHLEQVRGRVDHSTAGAARPAPVRPETGPDRRYSRLLHCRPSWGIARLQRQPRLLRFVRQVEETRPGNRTSARRHFPPEELPPAHGPAPPG